MKSDSSLDDALCECSSFRSVAIFLIRLEHKVIGEL